MLRNLVLLLTVITFSTQSLALEQAQSRKGTWNISVIPTVTNSKVLQFENGSEADINKRSGFGIGFGYNFDGHLELGMVFASSNSNYTGTRVLDDGNGTAERFSANLYTSALTVDLAYYFLKGVFTPYVNGYIGSTYIDSGIPTGNISTGCWWDPWWGYICTPVAQTYTSTAFSYGFGGGLRYDFNRYVFLKAGAVINNLDLNTTNDADFTTYTLGIGFKF